MTSKIPVETHISIHRVSTWFSLPFYLSLCPGLAPGASVSVQLQQELEKGFGLNKVSLPLHLLLHTGPIFGAKGKSRWYREEDVENPSKTAYP